MSARRPRPSATPNVPSSPTETPMTVRVAPGIVRRRPAAETAPAAPSPLQATPVATREALVAAILRRREFDPALLEMLWPLLSVVVGEA